MDFSHVDHMFSHEDNSGFGTITADDVRAVNKAMQVGYGTDAAGYTGARALTLESLEDTLKLTTFSAKQFEKSLWKILKERAKTARSTVEEFTEFASYGASGAFMGEMEDPEETDNELLRRFGIVRYLRRVCKVSDVSKLVKTQEDPETNAVRGATFFLMEQAERYLYDGDSTINNSEWDGLAKIMADVGGEHVIDLRDSLGEEALVEGARVIADNYGIPSHLFIPHAAMQETYAALSDSKMRINLPIVSADTVYGAPPDGLRTPFGEFYFSSHPFVGLRKQPYKNKAGVEVATSSKAPAKPTLVAAPVAPEDADGSKWAAGDAGTISYRVSAENNNGESVASTADDAAVVATGAAQLTLTEGGGTYPATGYRIYRKNNRDNKYYLVARVPASIADGQWVDNNLQLPGYETAYLLDLDSVGETENIAWKQLAPMGRKMLAPIGSYIWWIQFLYGFPQVYNPAKFVKFVNCKPGLKAAA